MPKVFISYRRSDTTPGYASWIYDRLVEVLGSEGVFMDIDSLPPGADFVEALERSLAQTDTALVLIGPLWLTAVDESGGRRLDDPEDFVRLEVEAVLRSGVRVIPVLVDDAQMPRSDALPQEIRSLARRQALVFTRYGGAAIRDLMELVHQADSGGGDTPKRLPQPASTRPKRGVPRRRGILLAAASVILAAAVAGALLAGGGGSGKQAPAAGKERAAASPGAGAPAQSAQGEVARPVRGAITVGNSPDAIANKQGEVLVANAGDGTITRLSEAGHVLGAFSYARHSGPAAPITLWQDAIWIGDSTGSRIDRLDPVSGRVIGSPVAVGGPPCAFTVASGSLWVANFNGTLARITAGSVPPHVSLTHLAGGPKRMTAFNGSLWIANSSNGTITRAALSTGQVVGVLHVGGHPAAIRAFAPNLWVAGIAQGTITRIDPSSGRTVGSRIRIGSGPRRITVGGGSLWVANSGDGTVTRIDGVTGRVVATIKVGGHPDAIFASNGVVWVSTWARQTPQYHGPPGAVIRVEESTGQVLTS